MNDDALIGFANYEFMQNENLTKCIVNTLNSMELHELIDTNTFDGISAWAIYTHVISGKEILLKDIDPSHKIRYEDENFTPAPGDADKTKWQEIMQYGISVHEKLMTSYKNLNAEQRSRKMTWGCSIQDAFCGMISHDVYHNSQIRNMGLNKFRDKQ